MRLEDVKYCQDNHFYYEFLMTNDRQSYQEYIDRFYLLKKDKDPGFVWVDLFNKLGQCRTFKFAKNDALSLARQQLYHFLGHDTMCRIVNKYAITDSDKIAADKAMKTFQTEFNGLISPEVSYITRCKYAVGF